MWYLVSLVMKCKTSSSLFVKIVNEFKRRDFRTSVSFSHWLRLFLWSGLICCRFSSIGRIKRDRHSLRWGNRLRRSWHLTVWMACGIWSSAMTICRWKSKSFFKLYEMEIWRGPSWWQTTSKRRPLKLRVGVLPQPIEYGQPDLPHKYYFRNRYNWATRSVGRCWLL